MEKFELEWAKLMTKINITEVAFTEEQLKILATGFYLAGKSDGLTEAMESVTKLVK